MTRIIAGGVTQTHDPVPDGQLAAHVAAALDCIAGGGIVIVPLDVAYAIVGHAPDAIRRIFAAKQRSYDKPCGMFGAAPIAREVHDLPEQTLSVIDRLSATGLPFSIVAPVRADHRFFAGTDPFSFARSSKDGTLDMLTNAGAWLAEMARQSWQRGMPVFGSSANRSLAGSKYRLQDIEPEVLAAADLAFDYGQSRYATPLGLASSIIDFRDFTAVRVGHRYMEVKAMLVSLGVEVKPGLAEKAFFELRPTAGSPETARRVVEAISPLLRAIEHCPLSPEAREAKRFIEGLIRRCGEPEAPPQR